jgi:hypothetical protein
MNSDAKLGVARRARTRCLIRLAMVLGMTLSAAACSGIDFGDRHVGNVPKPDSKLTAPPAHLQYGGEP